MVFAAVDQYGALVGEIHLSHLFVAVGAIDFFSQLLSGFMLSPFLENGFGIVFGEFVDFVHKDRLERAEANPMAPTASAEQELGSFVSFILQS